MFKSNKGTMFSLAVLAFTTLTASAFGLVREVHSCTTSDGKYTVTVMDNQGIGPVRTSHFFGTIKNSNDDVVGSYELKFVEPGVGPVSFRHADYKDKATDGKKFDFAEASTNTPKAIIAELNDGTKIYYGLKFSPKLNQGDLDCQP